MSQPIYNVFQEVEAKGRVLSSYWQGFYEEISQHLPESYQGEMSELSQKLSQALENLIDELHNPTLTLATTGTTSSGKSTLVNFLCGAEIVPVATSEMSAGVVTIEYSRDKALIIEATPGATWECGQWYGIGDQEIYNRLHDVMIEYIDRREDQPDLACPQSLIYYPFRLVKDLGLELPHRTKVRILDLPGLAYVGDEGNASVIRQCREALCLVTYNSAETDALKVKNLLQEVVSQVKDLGGSPARMLFILNRIDVFRADRTWPMSEERFVEKAVSSIKGELLDQLREYTQEIEALQVIKLSTWPALLALQARSSDVLVSVDACKRADNHFNGLIEDILEDLPRSVQKWSDHDRHRVAETLWEKSYGKSFQSALHEHIGNHFPQLVIPQMIDRFNVTAGNAVVEWAIQTTSAILNSSQEKYDQQCQYISQIRSLLDTFIAKSSAKLKEPFEALKAKLNTYDKDSVDDSDTKIQEIRTTLNKLIADLENFSEGMPDEISSLLSDLHVELLQANDLSSLYQWRDSIRTAITQVLEIVAESIKKGSVNLDSVYLKRCDSRSVKLLSKCIHELVQLGYTGKMAEDGKKVEAKTKEEKAKLKDINDKLDTLALNLSVVIEDVYNRMYAQEVNRMYEALSKLFKVYLQYLEDGSNRIAENMAIQFPASELIEVNPDFLKLTLNFKAGFVITEGTWQEAVEVEYTKRSIKTLWLIKHKKTRIDYKPRKSDNANIPSVYDLDRAFITQSKEAESHILEHILNWQLQQIDVLKKKLSDLQTEIIDRYQVRLDKAYHEAKFEHDNIQETWQPIHQTADQMAQAFKSFSQEI